MKSINTVDDMTHPWGALWGRSTFWPRRPSTVNLALCVWDWQENLDIAHHVKGYLHTNKGSKITFGDFKTFSMTWARCVAWSSVLLQFLSLLAETLEWSPNSGTTAIADWWCASWTYMCSLSGSTPGTCSADFSEYESSRFPPSIGVPYLLSR